jgi:CspA family cold shock protein
MIMSNGTVKFFNEAKGFGFIKEENSDKEYFVHSTGLIDRINENDEVTFDVEMGKKGLNAVNVKLA